MAKALNVIRNIWRLAGPYFVNSDEKWYARGLLATIVFLSLATVAVSVLLNFWRAAFYNSVQTHDEHAFLCLLLFWHRERTGLTFGYAPLALLTVLVSVCQVYLTQQLQIKWRRWMTEQFVTGWLSRRAFYEMSLFAETPDNPDQRIAEDVRDFCQAAIDLMLQFISRVVTLLSFMSILWALSRGISIFGVVIPGCLFWIALLYAVVSTCLTHLAGRRLGGLYAAEQHAEADFRYSLVRIRENAEAIALQRGEANEQTRLLAYFSTIIGNWKSIMGRMFWLNLVGGLYGQGGTILPAVVLAPSYFAGMATLGTIFQATEAFGRVENGLSWFIDAYNQLSQLRAVVKRLGGFEMALAAMQKRPEELVLTETEDGAVEMNAVDSSLPDGTALLQQVTLTFAPGTAVSLSGPSGAGKSTLFRTLAGIWPFAKGEVRKPRSAFFVPQRPYFPLGTLRDVVAYPKNAAEYGDELIGQALMDVGMGRLSGELGATRNWGQCLSGGEQQRVAYARVLLAKPSWVFLDEATANLDGAAEAALYGLLKERLPNTTVVSISHRSQVSDYHATHFKVESSGKVVELEST